MWNLEFCVGSSCNPGCACGALSVEFCVGSSCNLGCARVCIGSCVIVFVSCRCFVADFWGC